MNKQKVIIWDEGKTEIDKRFIDEVCRQQTPEERKKMKGPKTEKDNWKAIQKMHESKKK